MIINSQIIYPKSVLTRDSKYDLKFDMKIEKLKQLFPEMTFVIKNYTEIVLKKGQPRFEANKLILLDVLQFLKDDFIISKPLFQSILKDFFK